MQQAQIEKTAKVKFATQADPAVLQTLKSIAASEGRQIQALVDEALRDYIERKTGNTPRRHVMHSGTAWSNTTACTGNWRNDGLPDSA